MTRSLFKFVWAFHLLGSVLAAAGEPELKRELPDTYTLDYPAAEQWCPPVRSTFVEATRTMSVVRGRRFRHQPNGGYGLPIKEKVGDQHLVHLGADLGWHQFGEPVFAIANGVVRHSIGASPPEKVSGNKPARSATGRTMLWGNLVVIEHRLEASDKTEYLTSIYGHLGADRRVKQGDIVAAGQQIGTIGRKHVQINGGYDPHLHFGIRQGRAAEIGAVLVHLDIDGQRVPVRIKSLDEVHVGLELARAAGQDIDVQIAGERFAIKAQGDTHVAPARMVWLASFPDFPLVGYDPTTEGWLDPIETLRSFQADTYPAPFRLAPRSK